MLTVDLCNSTKKKYPGGGGKGFHLNLLPTMNAGSVSEREVLAFVLAPN